MKDIRCSSVSHTKNIYVQISYERDPVLRSLTLFESIVVTQEKLPTSFTQL